jgi:hypothetical protein
VTVLVILLLVDRSSVTTIVAVIRRLVRISFVGELTAISGSEVDDPNKKKQSSTSKTFFKKLDLPKIGVKARF